MAKIVVVTGGARSGKSTFAEQYAQKMNGKVAYIATAEVYDAEMAHRVKLHQERRPPDWLTFEEPLEVARVLAEASQQASVVLIDCLTLYTSNLLLAYSGRSSDEVYQYIKSEITKLIETAKNCPAVVIFVTNEVGQGIVPDNSLARQYRDLAGIVNQQSANAAQQVYLLVSGLAIELKQLAYNMEA